MILSIHLHIFVIVIIETIMEKLCRSDFVDTIYKLCDSKIEFVQQVSVRIMCSLCYQSKYPTYERIWKKNEILILLRAI